MGTSALIRVYDEDDKLLLSLQAQSDGFPDNLALKLFKRLGHLKIVNGLQDDTQVANGMGCFAAQLVAALKERAGGYYVVPMSFNEVETAASYDYVYDFRQNQRGHAARSSDRRHLVLAISSNGVALYRGPFADFSLKALFDPHAEENRKFRLKCAEQRAQELGAEMAALQKELAEVHSLCKELGS